MPKNPDHETMVSHILHTYGKATSDQVEDGMSWYRDAHNVCLRMALSHDITVEQAAGIIASLSPLTPWMRNLQLAEMLLDEPGERLPTLQGSAAKASAILSGSDPWAVLTSQKVRAFFEGILYNGATDAVCVDRHALSVAHGGTVPKQQQGMTPKQYGAIAAAYVDAASQVGIPAAKLQAITWVTWRSAHNITD